MGIEAGAATKKLVRPLTLISQREEVFYMKFKDMPYNRPDVEKMSSEIAELIENFKASSSCEQQISVIKQLEKVLNHYSTMESIANIRSTIDTRDEFYEKEMEFYDSYGPVLSEKINSFNKEMLSSSFRKDLEARISSVAFKNAELQLKSLSPDIIALKQEENRLSTEYTKLYASAQIPFEGKVYTIAQLGRFKKSTDRDLRKRAFEAEGSFFDEHRKEFDEIYDKMVKNRTEQAKKLGFDNFVPLGYMRQMRNCYGINEVANFRKQVLEDLVPIVLDLKKVQAKRLGLDGLKMYDDDFHFLDGDPTPKGTPDEILADGIRMYKEMSPETKEFIELMEDMELFDLLAKEGKAPGGYCTSLPDYKCPYIFANFNGTDHDVEVLTHEAGHAFADYVASRTLEFSSTLSPSLEGCETHSMSMEFLTSPWHHLFFKEDTEKYELTHAEKALSFIPYGTMVDYFQQLVYENPQWTPEERNETWAQLENKFRPWIDKEGMPFYGRGAGWQRQAHIYQAPFYYLDYCLAQTNALQIFSIFLNDKNKAWDTYMNFVKMGGTRFFTDLCRENGLKCPIDSGCLKETVEKISPWLSEKQKPFIK